MPITVPAARPASGLTQPQDPREPALAGGIRQRLRVRGRVARATGDVRPRGVGVESREQRVAVPRGLEQGQLDDATAQVHLGLERPREGWPWPVVGAGVGDGLEAHRLSVAGRYNSSLRGSTVRLTYDGASPPVARACRFGRVTIASHGFSAVPGWGRKTGKSLEATCRRNRWPGMTR